jgi:hypothetical protein
VKLQSIAMLAAFIAAILMSAPVAASVTMPPGAITVPSSGMFLYLNSQAGDFVGRGIEQLYVSPDAGIVARLEVGGDQFYSSSTQGTHGWQVVMAAAPGSSLLPGSYTGATGNNSTSRVAPALAVSGDGRGCNTAFGQFDVSEVSFAPTGELLVFDATFEQHCDLGGPALFGRIRISNPPPTPGVTLPSGSMTIPTGGNFFYLVSQPGDYVGGGTEQLYTGADSNIKGLFLPGTPGSDYFSGRIVQPNNFHNWSVVIAGAPGEQLVAGSYISARRANFQPAGHPGLEVSGDGNGCNTLTGKFDVDELSFWPTGDLKTFQATFEQHCSGAIPALFGRIRIETPAPLPPLEITINIRSEGAQDNKSGTATISGVVFCSRPASVDLDGTVSQAFANKIGVGGRFIAHVDCLAPSTKWSGTAIPDGQGFNSGTSQATVEAIVSEYFHSFYASAAGTVKLNASK